MINSGSMIGFGGGYSYGNMAPGYSPPVATGVIGGAPMAAPLTTAYGSPYGGSAPFPMYGGSARFPVAAPVAAPITAPPTWGSARLTVAAPVAAPIVAPPTWGGSARFSVAAPVVSAPITAQGMSPRGGVASERPISREELIATGRLTEEPATTTGYNGAYSGAYSGAYPAAYTGSTYPAATLAGNYGSTFGSYMGGTYPAAPMAAPLTTAYGSPYGGSAPFPMYGGSARFPTYGSGLPVLASSGSLGNIGGQPLTII